ncbi:MAG: GGDEF domain-containing protein [Pseudomonadota bacterium]
MHSPTLPAKWRSIVETVDYAFQPIVNIHTGVCFGHEALLRQVDKAGFDAIDAFFDAAADDGVLHAVDMALRNLAVGKYAARFAAAGTKLFFNLDNRVLNARDVIPGGTHAILTRYGLSSDRLCFEISERHELRDFSISEKVISHYRRQGYNIAADDCGNGFSGFKLLYYLEPEFTKIDRFFIQEMATDSKKRMIAASIVNIAHLMGSTVVAEGVETEKEFYSCREIGCDLIQGYLIQRPTLDMNTLLRVYEDIASLAGRDKRGRSRKDISRIQDNMIVIPPVTTAHDIHHVLKEFQSDKDRTFVPVVNGNHEPLGAIRERDLKEFTYSRFGQELLQNPAYGKNINRFLIKFPVADIHTPVEKILEIYTQKDDLEGIILVDNLQYAGFLSAQSLLKVLNEKNLATARDQNPLSRLPGNTVIHEYVSTALGDLDREFTLVYFDFDNFKPFNDSFGFRHGDRVILLFADILKSFQQRTPAFIGHVGGDDFFLGGNAGDCGLTIASIQALTTAFKKSVESFYDLESIRRGYILGCDRSGRKCEIPLLTVSAVVVELCSSRDQAYSPEEIGSLIACLKKKAKANTSKLCVTRIGGVPVPDDHPFWASFEISPKNAPAPHVH